MGLLMSSASGAPDVAFARGAIAAMGFFMKLDEGEAYDRIFEECRHALLYLDTTLSPSGRSRLRPLLDVLTAAQVQAWHPVGTGVCQAGSFGLTSFQEWSTRRPEEHVVMLRALPIHPPRSRRRRALEFRILPPELHPAGARGSVLLVSEFVQCCNPSQARSMMAHEWWDRLRATGLQDATAFFDHGICSLDDIMPNASPTRRGLIGPSSGSR